MASWEAVTGPAAVDTGANYHRQFEWEHGTSSYTWEMELPSEIYELHRRRHRIYDYGAYVADAFTQRLFDEFCESVRNEAADAGLSRRETVECVARFVQSLSYTADSVSAGYSNYPRYPVETLVDETGDCEDTSLLLAALLYGLGYRVGLLEFESHLAVGVDLEGTPDNVTFDGVGYTYVETTGTGWDVGEVPADHLGQEASLHRIGDSPVLYTSWRGTTRGATLHCAGTVHNRGEGPARDAEFQVVLADSGNETVGVVRRHWDRLAPGERVEWRDEARIETDRQVSPEWTLAIRKRIHDRGEGDPKRV